MKIAILSLIVVIMAGAAACAPEASSPSQGALSAPTGDQTPVASTSPSSEATLAVPAPIAPPGMTPGAPSAQFLDSGVEFRWGASTDDPNYLDPVPADAKELTFVIPAIGLDWKVPWEFKVKLN